MATEAHFCRKTAADGLLNPTRRNFISAKNWTIQLPCCRFPQKERRDYSLSLVQAKGTLQPPPGSDGEHTRVAECRRPPAAAPFPDGETLERSLRRRPLEARARREGTAECRTADPNAATTHRRSRATRHAAAIALDLTLGPVPNSLEGMLLQFLSRT